MSKLSNAQLLLLTGASDRADRCVVAPTGAKRRQALRAADQLVQMGFLKNIRGKANTPVWRTDEESGLSYSLKLTAAGMKAMAVEISPREDSALESPPM